MKTSVISHLHPDTLKHLIQGHPWITFDRYSEKFDKEAFFLIYKEESKQWIFIHDPTHPHIRARLWKVVPKDHHTRKECNEEYFFQWVKNKIKEETQHFFKQFHFILEKRNHFYLMRGHQPEHLGLQLLVLGDQLYCQTQGYFWKFYQPMLKKIITELQEEEAFSPLDLKTLWLQERSTLRKEQKPARILGSFIPDFGFDFGGEDFFSESKEFEANEEQTREEETSEGEPREQEAKQETEQQPPREAKLSTIHEYSINYQIILGKRYDHGFYTDMSTIRWQMINSAKELFDKKKVLNLFSYTGGLSLLSLAQGAEEVVSVDQCEFAKMMMKKNFNLNEQLDKKKHLLLSKDIFEGLKWLKLQHKKFDTIIIDPPTSFTSLGKIQKTIKIYPELVNEALKLLSPKGFILIFINTLHSGQRPFESLCKELEEQFFLSVIKNYRLSQECVPIMGLPESDYLRGTLFQRKQVNLALKGPRKPSAQSQKKAPVRSLRAQASRKK